MKNLMFAVSILCAAFASSSAQESKLDWNKDLAGQFKNMETAVSPAVPPAPATGEPSRVYAADRAVDSALVKGLGYAATVLNNPAPQEDSSPYSLRAIVGMNQNAEIGMSIAFSDALADLKDPVIKKIVQELNSTMVELGPGFSAGGSVAAWKSYVAAQEELHKTIEKRVLALQEGVPMPAQTDGRAVDCALVTGLGYAATVLNNPAPQEDSSPYSLRAIVGMNQNAEIGMSIAFSDALADLKDPVIKKIVQELNSTMVELGPGFSAGGSVAAWKSYVAAQEELHKTIEKRVLALKEGVCKLK